jgi:hypothetical protein
MILGLPWMRKHDIQIRCAENEILFPHSELILRTGEQPVQHNKSVVQVSAAVFGGLIRKQRRERKESGEELGVWAVSLADIQKALAPKVKPDVRKLLPELYYEFEKLFQPEEAKKLPPFRGKGIDFQVDLIKEKGQEPQIPYGPLYQMSRDELLVLRRTLLDLLDQGFIRVSHSPAAAPVLFVRKPNGGLRFCCDYRALNAITRKDRYPLPLIQETLTQLSRAKWFTTLDVVAAFNKIRMKRGEEWKVAFRTRYGLFEWLVLPFGLANGPSAFQKFINQVLQDFLDDFVTAYVDDILVYTNGSLAQHQAHVRKVLQRLEAAGLQLDISKCRFEQQSTKYLGYIIDAKTGIRMDPEKVKAVQDWQFPTTVKGVRGFLGFANFYRKFIPAYSEISQPLTALTKAGVRFEFGPEEKAAFMKLKQSFANDQILAPFDYARTTFVEVDASKWAVGATLLQKDEVGSVRPVAYFSKRMVPAESRYPIYDKEMLAIVRALEEWDALLRSVKHFTVRTDHKNLAYFAQLQKLNDRQVRWSLFLSRFNCTIMYKPGKENVLADALSRRDQDIPYGQDDERITVNHFQMLLPVRGRQGSFRPATSIPVMPSYLAPPPANPRTLLPRREAVEVPEGEWETAIEQDLVYRAVRHAVVHKERSLPTALPKMGISLGECQVREDGRLTWREREWVPDSEKLRTGIVQTAHEALSSGHAGREETYRVVARTWFWPGMSAYIRRYIRNCVPCRKSKPWRDGKAGLLKPLPLPSRTWRELSVDFIGPLPPSEGHTMMMVVTDRLGKGCKLIPMRRTEAVDVAWAFIQNVYCNHGFPDAIVSDRGRQFISDLWRELCTLLQVKQRLSSAYHPETDGSTERMNSTTETVVRTYVNEDQNNWAPLCPIIELMINSRTAASTGVSPFFLMHGYENDPFPQYSVRPTSDNEFDKELPGKERAHVIAQKLQRAADIATASMAYAQQMQETQANRSRKPAPVYRVGDQVWLDLRDMRTGRRSKKLDWKTARYTVTRVRDPFYVTLDVPGETRTFHVSKVRPAATDPFPSQPNPTQPPIPITVRTDKEEGGVLQVEYQVEAIGDERVRGAVRELLVFWSGYDSPTWEPVANVEDTQALDLWEQLTVTARTDQGKLQKNWKAKLYWLPTGTGQEIRQSQETAVRDLRTKHAGDNSIGARRQTQKQLIPRPKVLPKDSVRPSRRHAERKETD